MHVFRPIRKYDVFQVRRRIRGFCLNYFFKVRTWSYPIYKYIYGREHHHDRPYSYTRHFATKSLYTPPLMTAETKSGTARRGYSGYNYVAGEHSFNFATRPWSTSTYRTLRTSHVTQAAWYWYGRFVSFAETHNPHHVFRSNLRHYNSYRPPAYTSILSTYSKPYF